MTPKHSGVEKVAWVHIVDRRSLVGRNQGRTLFYLPGGSRGSRTSRRSPAR